MSKPSSAKRPVSDLIQDIVGQVIELTWCYSIWWVVADKSNRPKYQTVLMAYPNYFKATFELYQATFFVVAHRLFDHEKSSVSLRSLVQSMATSNPTLTAVLEKKLDGSADRLSKVLRVRHNVYGHRSKSISPQTEFARLGIKPNDMKALVQLAQEIIIELAVELGEPESGALADKFKRCEQDVRDETFMILEAIKKCEGL